MTAPALDFAVSTDLARDLRQWRTRSLIVGVIGAVLLFVGLFVNPFQFYRSYLWAYTFCVGLASGSLAWLMLQYLTGGAWGVVIRRPAEAAVRTLPLLAVMFLPIVIGIPNLYEWSHADKVKADEILQHKQAYLNVPFFIGRAVLYFAGWILLSWLLNKWSEREDREGGLAAHNKMAAISGPGLVFWGFSVTFMSIDWLLSLNPHWFSTMFGLLIIAGQSLSALAFLITILVYFSARPPMNAVLTPRHLHDIGKLLLALVMVWAYFSFSQFLIIWTGDLPEEIPWYLARMRGGWGYFGLALVFGHFALPFALLLSRDLKRNFKLLRNIAVFILFMRLVDLYWVIAPEFHKGEFAMSWMDLAAPVGIIGLWLAYFFLQLEKRPLMPINEPHLMEALEHGRE
jgi:putative effector of murein hydrolase LrgA (UPF0299 family)